MKICYFPDKLPETHRNWSGAELLCRRIANAVSRLGHEAYFITEPFEKEHIDDKIYEINVNFSKINSNILTLSGFLPRNILLTLHIKKHLKTIQPDVVHIIGKHIFPSALAASSSLRIPLVFTVVDHFLHCPKCSLFREDGSLCEIGHGLHCHQYCHYLSSKNRLSDWKGKWLAQRRPKIFKKYIEKLNKIIALSETSRKTMVRFDIPEDKIEVIYHFHLLNDLISSENVRSGTFKQKQILFVGTLNELRGARILVEAFPEIASFVPSATMVIIGDGDKSYVDSLKKFLFEKSLNSRVKFLGKLDNTIVVDYIKSSEIVAVPLQWPNEYGPLILTEAMGYGKPVIASKVGAIPEFVEDGKNGLLVSPNDPHELATKMVKLLLDENLKKRLSENAMFSAEKWFSSTQTDKLIDLYRSVSKK